MSVISKRTVLSMGVGIAALIVYVIYALGEASPAADDLKSWALALLVYIGVCIVAVIIIEILFHIILAVGISVKEKESDAKKIDRIIKSSMIEDERDRLINLKSSHTGYACAGVGFVIGLIALALGVSAVAALHIMAGGFALGSVIEGCMSVYFYEKGVHNG